ncbi:tail spike protein [Bacillus phage Eldridge]|uniref:Tail spike protein n=1 Tax=Bacillus phage Eldridge TaxID=1776293 RepID=A0A0Y0DBF5_9CAUD|nr:tail spike protein [Bacillus phage Eldridge]AMB18667.1 tail spike protein [Bacillus phage Eldridge]
MLEKPNTFMLDSDVQQTLQTNTTNIAKLQDRNKMIVTPEEYGAVGDGVADDTTPLQNMINAIQGTGAIAQLRPSSKYKITNTLAITGSIAFKGDTQNRPKIFSTSQTFTGMTVDGTLVGTTQLAASATINMDYIDVVDAANIAAGNLIEIVSSKSWYHDAREDSTDARKAELHRVEKVTGNRVYLSDGLFDGYVLANETVDVNIYTPIRFSMHNVELALTKYAGNTDTVRKVGIVLNHTIDALLENVHVTDAQNAGLSIQHSYRPVIQGGKTSGANNYFSGYGVQIVGCTHARVYNRFTTSSRRGVDVSGFTVPSHHTVIEGCTVVGSGYNSMGEKYGFLDNHGTGAYCGGIGTHGPADHTVIRNNTFQYLHTAIIDRSRNMLAEGNYFIGDFAKVVIDASFGENNVYKNNTCVDNYSGLKEKTISDGGANINTRRPKVFIRFQATGLVNGSSGGFAHVEGNFAMVQDTFIEFYGEAADAVVPTLKNFTIKDNTVYFAPYASTDPAYFVNNATVNNASILMSGSVFRNNSWKRTSGSGPVYVFGKVDPRQASEVDGPKAFSFYMTDDSVSSILLGNSNMFYARMIVDAGGSSGGAYGCVRIGQGYSTTNDIGTSNNIAGVASVPTGTTGTDGKLNLAVQDGVLYVENRLGSTQRIMITVMNAV